MYDDTSSNTPSYACFDDPLYLSMNDQPSMQVVPYLFDDTKFLSWKRDAYFALVAKNKEGFVDGTCKMPAETEKSYRQWVRCDHMVRKWLSNSLIPDIKATVEYSPSARVMWSDLLERYGQVNSIELYQLRKEFNESRQSNNSVVEYYSNLKRTWETLDSLDPIPVCTCGALDSCSCSILKRMLERESNTKLI
ncbi:uncharacterized protein LOC141608609 [Silene latifolia]|uniref:uncharacterized protein LOC141608609 n=1 Tax=Silene latifolia TaxID=37657 RepID=UPI003D779135